MRGHAAHVNTAVLAVMNIRILLTQIWLSGQNLQRYAVYLSGTFFGTLAYRPSQLLDTVATNYHQMQYTKIEISRYFRTECIYCLAKRKSHSII